MIRIVAPHFVAGICVDTGRSAPILAYMPTWSVDRIVRYCERKGWQWETLDLGRGVVRVGG